MRVWRVYSKNSKPKQSADRLAFQLHVELTCKTCAQTLRNICLATLCGQSEAGARLRNPMRHTEAFHGGHNQNSCCL